MARPLMAGQALGDIPLFQAAGADTARDEGVPHAAAHSAQPSILGTRAPAALGTTDVAIAVAGAFQAVIDAGPWLNRCINCADA